ncbi:hypothetical protein [Psychrobacter sp. SC65A.3]|uniref:hypothetical protein n=1 Tax=Psychrobacter sp. SC65A.3 TaxID=2983299 RepID=UPI0021D95B72|nr:hypothetical protein [Psychrobacter sp. SC65A.3]
MVAFTSEWLLFFLQAAKQQIAPNMGAILLCHYSHLAVLYLEWWQVALSGNGRKRNPNY